MGGNEGLTETVRFRVCFTRAPITPIPSTQIISQTLQSSMTVEFSAKAPVPLPYPRLPAHHLLPSKRPDYLRLILSSKVYDIVKETPLVYAPNLSAKFGNQIWLKREDLQEVFSFKIRGAYNFMASLNDEERWKGVITCSAGQCA